MSVVDNVSLILQRYKGSISILNLVHVPEILITFFLKAPPPQKPITLNAAHSFSFPLIWIVFLTEIWSFLKYFVYKVIDYFSCLQ